MIGPPRLTVDPTRILEVLTGDRFYSTKDAALREAVLNAVDACTRRAGAGDDTDPRIGVQFNDASYEVTVTDNGDGMGAQQVTSLFTKIGASMAQVAAEVETVGEFGIGVVSYFLACDSFEIHSVRPGERPVGMIFDRSMLDELTPATEVPCARDDQGTTLILRVRDQQQFKLLFDRYSHWFRAGESCQRLRQIRVVQSATNPSYGVGVGVPAALRYPGRRSSAIGLVADQAQAGSGRRISR